MPSVDNILLILSPIIATVIGYFLVQYYSKPKILFFPNSITTFQLPMQNQTPDPKLSSPEEMPKEATSEIDPKQTLAEKTPSENTTSKNESNSQQKTYLVFSASITLVNNGRTPATNVKLSHFVNLNQNVYYTIYPNNSHTLTSLHGGGSEICIPTITPKEYITISYLYFPPTYYQLLLSHIKFDQGLGKQIDTIPAQVLKDWQKKIIYMLLFVGVSTSVYLILKFGKSLLHCAGITN